MRLYVRNQTEDAKIWVVEGNTIFVYNDTITVEEGDYVGIHETLNELLVGLFHNIMDIEEKALITEEFKDMTNNDVHVMEAIGIGKPKNMSAIAKELSVTVGTLTISMNSLVKKGYVIRERGISDRRVVYISLSDKGKKAYEHHARFHKEMIEAVIKGLNEEQKDLLASTLTKLNHFFVDKTHKEGPR